MSFSADFQELELLENIKIFFQSLSNSFFQNFFLSIYFPTCFIHNAFLYRFDHLLQKALVKRFLELLILLQRGALYW